MLDKPFTQPSLVRLLLGLLIVIGAFGVVLRLPEVIKYVSAPFLVLPAQLGLVQQPTPAEVLPLMPEGTTTVSLPHAGRYAIYAINYSLWCQPEPKCRPRPGPLIPRVIAVQTRRDVLLVGVERGLRPYDTPFAQGSPLQSFVADAPGDYRFWTDGYPDTQVAIVPDYTTGHEATLLIAGVAQFVTLVVVGWGVVRVLGRRQRVRRQQRATARTERTTQAETFWQGERERQQRPAQEPPGEAPVP